MKVTLLDASTVELIDHALGECYDQGPKYHKDNEGAVKRISKVCNVYKHDSLMEFGSATWEIEASAKTLLQMTRHRMASYAAKSTRYTLNKSELQVEQTGDIEIDANIQQWLGTILRMQAKGKSNDLVSMMLPMAYRYRWQVQFNYRSLKNFMALRLDKHAQKEIREVAELMLKSLPEEIQDLILER